MATTTATGTTQAKARAKAIQRPLRERMREHKTFYIMVAPFFIFFGLFGAFPMLAAIYLGFTQWDGLTSPEFVGFDNYVNIIGSPTFFPTIFNTIYIWVGSTILTCGLAFVLAYVINEYVLVGKNLVRMIFLLPLLVAPAVMAMLTSMLFGTNGLVAAFVRLFAGQDWTVDFIHDEFWIKPVIIFVIVFRYLGFHMVLFVAGLQTIPRELYDAAKVDGAAGWRIFTQVTFPMMLPVIFFSVTSSTVGAFQLFDEPYLLTAGTPGPNGSAEVLGTLLYRTGFNEFRFGTASALSWIIFALIATFTIINSRLLRARNV